MSSIESDPGGSGAGSMPHQPSSMCVDTCDNPYVCRDEWDRWAGGHIAQLRADLEAARGESEKWQRLYDEAQQRVIVYEAELAQARVMATNYKVDAELQSERVTEQRTELLPQIASLQTDLAQAQARIVALEADYQAAYHAYERNQAVVEAARVMNDVFHGIGNDGEQMAAWATLNKALAALDAAQEQPGAS